MDEWTRGIIHFFNNSSVAAFLGAFSAFFLVALTDWWRKYKKKGLIKRQISILKETGISKKAIAQSNIDSLRSNKCSVSPVMKFPVDDLRTLRRETLDILSSTQVNAIDGLIFWMESIDGVFERALALEKELAQLVEDNAPNEARSAASEKIQIEYNQVITHLGHFENMANFYVNNEPEKILTYQVERR